MHGSSAEDVWLGGSNGASHREGTTWVHHETPSPLDVSARYLRHLVQAWNHAHKSPDEHLEKQPVVLTVPASFDDVARNLTVEAAKKAGYENLINLKTVENASKVLNRSVVK
jgi:molecular chaperone DnaK (HSP70)